MVVVELHDARVPEDVALEVERDQSVRPERRVDPPAVGDGGDVRLLPAAQKTDQSGSLSSYLITWPTTTGALYDCWELRDSPTHELFSSVTVDTYFTASSLNSPGSS